VAYAVEFARFQLGQINKKLGRPDRANGNTTAAPAARIGKALRHLRHAAKGPRQSGLRAASLDHLTVWAPDPHLCAGDRARRQLGSQDADASDAIESELQGRFDLGIERGSEVRIRPAIVRPREEHAMRPHGAIKNEKAQLGRTKVLQTQDTRWTGR